MEASEVKPHFTKEINENSENEQLELSQKKLKKT